MALITGERNQISFLPPSIEDTVSPDDPVRAYDAFFDPVVMLKLLVYMQSVVDDQHGTLETPSQTVCADAGYAN